MGITAAFWVFAVFFWLVPALVGIWTQIRAGLPSFARAPRTIIAAANYEAHRLIYLGLVIVVAIGAEASLRILTMNGNPRLYAAGSVVLFWTTFSYGALSWAGAIRSDYRSQLIQSRRHAVRFVLMYGFFFPFPLAGIVVALFAIFFSEF
ncbi:MAG: hypothetical protein ACE5GE_12800 [Phycisphaerae bacterium]